VFKVLTPAQQSQLATLEAQHQSQKRGGWGGPPPPEAQ
jgi:Spy/CpxP family protein refolding chaperone